MREGTQGREWGETRETGERGMRENEWERGEGVKRKRK